MDTILTNYLEIKEQMVKHQDAKLIVVSKNHPLQKLTQLIAQNHIHFGENRLNEAKEKWLGRKEKFPKIKLHYLGQIQSNKLAQITDFFDYIHALDRKKIALALNKIAKNKGKLPKLFIQVNTGNEPQKAGIPAEKVDVFVEFCRNLELPIIGLMAIPPINSDKNYHYQLLNDLAKQNNLNELSMGMSDDYQTALKYQATFIRIGTKILGEREY